MKNLLRRGKGRLAWKMHIFRQRYFAKFIFIHINKTAGTSIQRALNIRHEHKTAREKIEEIGRKRWENKFSFAVIRNPWDKVVSHYHYRVKSNQTGLKTNPVEFKDWVKLTYGNQDPFYYNNPKMFMPQTDWIADRDGQILVDFICRFEKLEQDFECVCKKLGKTAELSHFKTTKHSHYRDYYNQETREIVSSWFEKDIRNFDYHY
jgi:hypothetical protein